MEYYCVHGQETGLCSNCGGSARANSLEEENNALREQINKLRPTIEPQFRKASFIEIAQLIQDRLDFLESERKYFIDRVTELTEANEKLQADLDEAHKQIEKMSWNMLTPVD